MARIASGARSDAHVEEIDLRSPHFWRPAWFLPHLSIRPKVGGVVPFKLRSHQVKLATAIDRCLAEGRWLVHLKARQEGATTFCAGVLMQHVMFREGVTAGMLGHKGADKKNSGIKNMVEMCKRYWRSIPAHQQPRLPPGMTNSLEFPDLDSVLLVEAARAEEPFRGNTLQLLLADEIAAWPNAESVWAAALNAVPDEGALVMAISTPHHYGDAMHTLCVNAQKPGSRWLYVFTPWTQLTEYRMRPPPGWRPSAEVIQYATKYKLDTEQAYWMEQVGLVKCGYSMTKFLAEYPPDDVSCWVRTGGEQFDAGRLMELLLDAQRGQEIREAPEELERWEMAVPGRPYILACDPTSDDAMKDQWGLIIMDGETGAVVVTYQGYNEAHRMAALIDRLSVEYNGARIYVENNGVGQAVLSHLKLRPNILDRLHGTAPQSEDSTIPMRWGWTSTTGSKVTAVSDLQEIVRDRTFTTQDERLIKQLLGYRGKWESGGARDESGGHFDLVAATAIAAWAYRRDRAKLRARSPSHYETRFGREAEAPSAATWAQTLSRASLWPTGRADASDGSVSWEHL